MFLLQGAHHVISSDLQKAVPNPKGFTTKTEEKHNQGEGWYQPCFWHLNSILPLLTPLWLMPDHLISQGAAYLTSIATDISGGITEIRLRRVGESERRNLVDNTDVSFYQTGSLPSGALRNYTSPVILSAWKKKKSCPVTMPQDKLHSFCLLWIIPYQL